MKRIKILEDAVEALKKQGRAVSECVYLDEGGLSCIVGLMMPDDETRKACDTALEDSLGIYELACSGVVPWVNQFSQNQIDVLKGLQTVHDQYIGRIPFEELIDKLTTYIRYDGVISNWEEKDV